MFNRRKWQIEVKIINKKLKGGLTSVIIHLSVILIFTVVFQKNSLEKNDYIFLEYELKPVVTKLAKAENLNSVPGYKVPASEGISQLENISIVSDTLEIIKNIVFDNVEFDQHSMVSLRNLTSMYLKEQFRKQDSVRYYNKRYRPESKAFDFSTFNINYKKGGNYKSEDNFKGNSFPGGGFELPIIPLLRVLGVL